MGKTYLYPACRHASVEELSHHHGSLQFGISDAWASLARTQKFKLGETGDWRDKRDLSFADILVQS